jgi:structural maintenance of chromosomes protein 5
MPVRRHQRLDLESDGDQDHDVLSGTESPGSRSSKRARVGERSSDSSSPEPERSGENRNRSRKNYDGLVVNSSTDHSELTGSDQYQPGAIIRVEVTNFVTYEKASFYPGPNLNMVIGPNGTGKSSLVCAICLGLGYGPAHLGRAGKVGEFVKHGYNDAIIEIELQKRPEDSANPIIRVKIIRDGDKRKWWINGTETSLKNIQALTREFGIQVDNLCQFLPQDRVSEFAGLNPVELLHHTQRAAAPEEMLVWHDELKTLRREQKSLQIQYETDQETLRNLESRQEGLRADVERLQERAKIQERIVQLEKSVPFLRYSMNLKRHREQQQLKKEAQRRLKELERQLEPTLRAVNEKQEYQSQVRAAAQGRKMVVQDAEKAAVTAVDKIDEVQRIITENAQKRKAEVESEKKRKQDLQKIQTKIRELEARLQNAPPAFNADEWNTRIVSTPCSGHSCR